MPITMKRQELQAMLENGTAKVKLPTPIPIRPVVPAPDTSVADVVAKMQEALSSVHGENLAIVMKTLALNEQIASIIAAMEGRQTEYQNWNVNITRRDSLGRIAEVQFRPAK